MKYTTAYIVDVLIHVSNSSSQTKFTTELKPPYPGERGEMKVVPVSLNVIQKISQVRLFFSNDLRPVESRLSVLRSIEEVEKRFPDGLPLIDPVKDMKITDSKFETLLKNISMFEQRLKQNQIHNSSDAQRLYELYERKAQLHNKVQEAKQDLKEAKSLLQMDELKCRKRVLRRLGYSSEGDVIQLKGRVACELSSADELLLTEMLFYGTFVDLEPAKATALLSCLVCDERSNDAPKLTDDLSGALKTMQEMARQIARVSKECKLEIDEDAYVEQFKPYLMDVVYEWCKGASFAKLCEMTEIFEGGIIRCMRRLEELLRQMSLAAKVIGNKDLEDKFNEGVRLLKRDIVFAASLYL